MSSQLPTDCLNEIFEHLENDTITLHSCLLVNRLYCKIVVEILWRNVCNSNYFRPYISLSIISTLFNCLPKESKDLLHKNGICFITLIQKPPLFNYPSFCKAISISKINHMIENVLRSQQLITSRDLNHSELLISHEILKMFMNQISSLKSLEHSSGYANRIKFIYSPGAKICLPNLVELKCHANIYPEFFYQISQICHNIQSLTIRFIDTAVISDGLTDLISLQNNLKSLTLEYCNKDIIRIITPSLAKSSLTITKLEINTYNSPLSFISMFINLQELILSLGPAEDPEDTVGRFDQLQYIEFPQLRILEFNCFSPKLEMVIKFLEINGKNLTKFNSSYDCKTMNLAIAKFCPNLKSINITYKNDELEALKLILSNCQFLESIKVRIVNKSITSKNLFDILAKYSPKNFHKLIISLLPFYKLEGLQEFLIKRKNCIPRKPLSLTINTDFREDIYYLDLKVIDIYSKMGVIKEFIIITSRR
ncbi:hypothetical protein RhiirA1_533171 [Rhizophagus irregularis]|uniref:F-box domain-containing protein n=1 Tax=Rhizophagus irregularis TaxID=588596 RepID=A0A2N0S2M6_9GLOM|nr:hypothetical protein RhiirA1_533171 [Rhizophagus irregularis]